MKKSPRRESGPPDLEFRFHLRKRTFLMHREQAAELRLRNTPGTCSAGGGIFYALGRYFFLSGQSGSAHGTVSRLPSISTQVQRMSLLSFWSGTGWAPPIGKRTDRGCALGGSGPPRRLGLTGRPASRPGEESGPSAQRGIGSLPLRGHSPAGPTTGELGGSGLPADRVAGCPLPVRVKVRTFRAAGVRDAPPRGHSPAPGGRDRGA